MDLLQHMIKLREPPLNIVIVNVTNLLCRSHHTNQNCLTLATACKMFRFKNQYDMYFVDSVYPIKCLIHFFPFKEMMQKHLTS